jgi:sortase (surface protein transpeptidase)
MTTLNKKKSYLTLGLFLWTLAVLFVLFPIWPHLYYRLSPKTSESLAQTISLNPSPKTSESSPKAETVSSVPNITLPPVDPSLPTKNGLIIENIGLRGEIHEGDNWQEILKLGIWRVPDFANPTQTNKPVILAAHRWGYLSWSNAFRKLNSFYNLPKLKKGDKISLIWEQRQFEYEIYDKSEGTAITDYSASLILYTCQLWNSPTRIFVYAKRI